MHQTRRAWARYIQRTGWGREVRATIHLRKQLGREPTKAEVDAAEQMQNDFKDSVTIEDVQEGYDSGKQVGVPLNLNLRQTLIVSYPFSATRHSRPEVRRL